MKIEMFLLPLIYKRSKYKKNSYQLSRVNTKIFNFRKSTYIIFVLYIVNWSHVYCYFILFKKFSTSSGFQIRASLRRCKGDMTMQKRVVAVVKPCALTLFYELIAWWCS